MLEAIYNKWKSKTVTGENEPKQQLIPNFINSYDAINMLYNHISKKHKIAIHCDVDLDGIGSGYIAKRFINNLSPVDTLCVINGGKEHGIKQRHADYFNQNPIDLMLIVDSSSNELDIIKQFNCDVLIVDHHEVDHNEFKGKTNDGEHNFIIVNNTLDNFNSSEIIYQLKNNNIYTSDIECEYHADSRMSCGVVLYELLRLYQKAYSTGPLLENLMLFQWAGVTLFTDAIPLLNERNQWFIENTVHSPFVEPTLKILLNELNKFSVTLDKSFINYTLAPTFNRAIRANANLEALNTVLINPYAVTNLARFRELQDWSISEGVKLANICEDYCKVNLTNSGIHKNYTGVIAGRVCDDNNKNTIAYTIEDDLAVGSFRGRNNESDYREYFCNFSDSIYAQGHKQAFGFKIPIGMIDPLMSNLHSCEKSGISNKPYLTVGNLPDNLKGEYHIDNIDEFKRLGGLMMLGIGNSKVSSDEQIMISVMSSDATLIEQRGKLYLYNVLGLVCKAFKEIDPGMINIYIESSKNMEFYIK